MRAHARVLGGCGAQRRSETTASATPTPSLASLAHEKLSEFASAAVVRAGAPPSWCTVRSTSTVTSNWTGCRACVRVRLGR